MDNRSSTSSFCFKLSESFGAISCGCKAQKTVATSTAEADFNFVVEASEEAIHLRGMFVDNQACIALSEHFMHHGKTIHFAIKLQFVLSYLTTENMHADILTKPLGIRKHSQFCTYMLGEI